MSAAGPLRLALLGGGAIARSVHLPLLRAMPGVQIVAVADADERLRQEAVRLAGETARPLADYRDALALPEVEAVVVALPTNLHAAAASAAFAAGKHVYLEKPIAGNVEEARRLLDAWSQASECIGMVGFNYRFNPLYTRLRQRLDAGAVGALTAVRSVFATPTANALPDWKRRTESGGGVLLDLASHHIDLLRFFTGREIAEVSAMALSQRSEEDSALINLRLRAVGGATAVAQILVSLCAADDDRWEFYGDGGRLAVDRYESVEARFLPARRQDVSPLSGLQNLLAELPRLSYRLEKRRSPAHEPSYGVAISRFVAACRSVREGEGRAVRTHPAVSPDLTDGFQSLRVIEAAKESIHSGGKAVVLEI